MFYTFPVLIVLAEPLVTPARFSLDRLVVALVAFCGVAMVVGPDLHGLDRRGLALALAASVFAATQFFAASASATTPLAPEAVLVASDHPAGDGGDPRPHRRLSAAGQPGRWRRWRWR